MSPADLSDCAPVIECRQSYLKNHMVCFTGISLSGRCELCPALGNQEQQSHTRQVDVRRCLRLPLPGRAGLRPHRGPPARVSRRGTRSERSILRRSNLPASLRFDTGGHLSGGSRIERPLRVSENSRKNPPVENFGDFVLHMGTFTPRQKHIGQALPWELSVFGALAPGRPYF